METTTLPDGTTASVRVHRSGSVEAMVGGQSYTLQPDKQTTSRTPNKSLGVGDLNNTAHHYQSSVTSPYLSPAGGSYSSSRLASSVLGQTSFSSNIHNSRAVLSALRALQDKIRNLEAERTSFSQQCSSLQSELHSAKERLHNEEDLERMQTKRLEESAVEFNKQIREYDIEAARQEEKLRALTTELDMVKEQAQRSATERKSAIDRLARVEMEGKKTEDNMLAIKNELAVEKAGRRSAEARVAELQQLVNRLMTTNEELMHKPTIIRKKRKKKKSTGTTGTKLSFGSRGSKTTKLSRARKEQANKDRAAAVSARRNNKGLSLKEQVRLANLGKDPPFMPSGNPRVDNNVYSITQKQLANPLAYGNVPSSSTDSLSHQNHFSSNESKRQSSPTPAAPTAPAAPTTSLPQSNNPLSSNLQQQQPSSPPSTSMGLGAVVEAIRHELQALTTRRDSILQNAANSPDGHLNLDQRTIDTALSDLQQKIDSKSRQIVLLEAQLRAQENQQRATPTSVYVQAKKRYSPRSPLRDTEASEKKQAALDLLRNYKTVSEDDHGLYQELHGRSMAAGGVPTNTDDANTSQRRGTYFGTYDSSEAKRLRELHRTASSF
jgi:predicted  nucleic acid-binding Zn-ribbon protein